MSTFHFVISWAKESKKGPITIIISFNNFPQHTDQILNASQPIIIYTKL